VPVVELLRVVVKGVMVGMAEVKDQKDGGGGGGAGGIVRRVVLSSPLLLSKRRLVLELLRALLRVLLRESERVLNPPWILLVA